MITSTTVQRPSAGNGRRATARRPARRVSHLRQLALAELRSYRQELITEESRVSYWRRILQARLDTAEGARGGRTPAARLESVLTQHQESSRRLAVLPVHDAVDAPPLPDLAVLWTTAADNGGDTVLRDRLAAAEVELSTYRRGLHERIDDATSELIARYREQPALALSALPSRQNSGAA